MDGLNGAFVGGFTFNGGSAYTIAPDMTGLFSNIPHAGTISVRADGSGGLDQGNFPFVTNGAVLLAIPDSADSGDPLLLVFMRGTLSP